MNIDKLNRYCQLKTQIKQWEDELEQLRRDITGEFAQDAEFSLHDYTLKLIYQEKRHYNDRLLIDALPDPELWKVLFKADPAKISALVKADLLNEKSLTGTYTTARIPYLYVTPVVREAQS
ncbi:hypothetical protein [Cohnella terricola]|uniref:Uncharacterized protein n=1 Tax=Cohnella terricola TaxID=1289167 RepID=A0A559JSW2_9BACL|nr:hypothetical protein [Cohnella terricola]TVY02966.1 hypothetical protein FPZ45_03485 [Cohnella terricola]